MRTTEMMKQYKQIQNIQFWCNIKNWIICRVFIRLCGLQIICFYKQEKKALRSLTTCLIRAGGFLFWKDSSNGRAMD